MKNMIIVLTALAALVFSCVSAHATTLIFDPAASDDWAMSGVMYGRAIELRTEEAGENRGNIYATSEYYYHPGRWGLEHFPIFESRDGGKSWTHISDIYDTEFTQKKFLANDDGTYREVPLGTEGATTYYGQWWGMIFQPTLYELPGPLGGMSRGTVLCVGTTTCNGHSAIVVYKSSDGLRSWEYLSTVSEGGKADMGIASAIWEGNLIYENGALYCFYSDERGMEGGGQRLVFKKTTDGVTWSDDVKVCDFEEENDTYRPGMPVVTKLPDGRFMIVYEGVNMGTSGYLPDFYKVTDNIEVWDYKDHGTEMTAFSGGSPYCATAFDGKVLIGSHGSSKVGINTDSLATNEWTSLDTSVESAYSRALVPLESGNLLIVSGGKHNATGARKLVCAVERIDFGEVLTPVSTDGTEPWGEKTPNYGNRVQNATDGDTATFFDGLKDGHVIIDLGEPKKITAVSFFPRLNFAFRMNGGKFYGSNDGESWSEIYTIPATPSNGVFSFVRVSGDAYRYVKYTSNGTEGCNVAEIRLYTSEEKSIKFDQKFITLAVSPIERGDDVLIPLRAISEEMGADVAWIAKTKSAAIILKGKLAIFKIGTKEYNFDGEDRQASRTIELIDGVTYVSSDALETVLGCTVTYNGSCVSITN